MKVLILSAMEEEIAYLVNEFNLLPIDNINEQNLYLIKNNTTQLYILNSGIGKVNAAITTTKMLLKYNVDKVISIGTSGALTTETNIGDFVNGRSLAYHDVNLTAFNYKVGQLPKFQKYFLTSDDSFWQTVLNTLNTQKAITIHNGCVVTGDQFISESATKKTIINNFENALCVEMESTAIVHTVKSFNIDCYVLRSISDNADGNANISFDTYLQKVCENYKYLVDIILNYE